MSSLAQSTNNTSAPAKDPADITKNKSLRRVVAASMIGNALEWYDYALYGIMAPLIAMHFFPAGDPTVQLLATYGVFAAGFVARPVGAIFFGWFGDKYGRRSALTLAILMMAIPTGCIGILPSYEEIGAWATVLLTVIRLLQGLSLGGEFSGSMIYLTEHAPQNKRGFIGSMSMSSLMLGFLLGAGVSAALSTGLTEEQFTSWGWRIAFGLGILIGLVGFYIRQHCDESPVYEAAKEEAEGISQTPMRDVMSTHKGLLLSAFLIYLTVTVPFYLTTIYFVSYTSGVLGYTLQQALNMNILNMFLMLFAVPVAAIACDRIGRKKVLMSLTLAMLFLTYPLFTLFTSGDIAMVALGQGIFALLVGAYLGPIPAALAEMFPTKVRFSGMSLAYNLAATIFGGTTPMICVWLIDKTENPLSIAYLIIICNILTAAALWKYKDRSNQPMI